MTRKLYYEDCHLTSFEAKVESCTETARGFEVILEATAFYPEGGGQACDLGTLGGAAVLDVQERGEEVVHLCDRPLETGAAVAGKIDYDRRFDLMQQHTGEHIVSGIIHRRYGYHNVGFHMGSEMIEIDFDGVVPAEDLAAIEREANAALWQNIPVKCWWPTQEELPHVFYRTKKALPWPVRVVEIPGFDSCACCGVHVAYTGEVGIIKILSCIKFHEGVRIEMLCGRRAYEYLSQVYDQNRLVSQTFSAKILQTGEAARRINEQLGQEKFRNAALEKRVFSGIAEAYAGKGDVVHFEDGLSSAGVRELTDAIAERCGGIAAVFSGTDEAGYNMCLIGKGIDVKPLGTDLSKALSGRGGGKPGSFQGSLKTTRQDIEVFFQNRG